jgi:hypothetical protein
MARTKKTQIQEDMTQAINEAINTPVGEYLCEVAGRLGISETDLKERLAAKLDNDDALDWDIIAPDYQPLVEAIQRDLESEASVRRLTPPQEETPQLPPQPTELALVEEEAPKPPKKGKQKSTRLTKNRVDAIQQTIQDTVTLEDGIHETELNVATQEGIQDGGQIATTYLVAKQVTENKIRKEAAKRRVAKTIQKTAKQQNFNPLAVLQKHGLNPTADDLQELNELATPALGTVGNATGEILSNSWANGLQIDCSDLTSLMSDAWSD